jgi:predicted DNA-binding protein (UPF0278 family)
MSGHNVDTTAAHEPPSVHTIEIPASLAHKLTEEQRGDLEKFAKGHPNARKLVVAVEHAMENEKLQFKDALEKAKKEHPELSSGNGSGSGNGK